LLYEGRTGSGIFQCNNIVPIKVFTYVSLVIEKVIYGKKYIVINSDRELIASPAVPLFYKKAIYVGGTVQG
jgi:hypothetical protein